MLFVSKNRVEVGARVGMEDGSFFEDQKDAIRHWPDGGGHVYEVEAERFGQGSGECTGGIIAKWRYSVSGVQTSQDENDVFKDVPDKEEIMGRLTKHGQGRALEHDPEGKAGKRWLRPYKKEATVAKMLERITDPKLWPKNGYEV